MWMEYTPCEAPDGYLLTYFDVSRKACETETLWSAGTDEPAGWNSNDYLIEKSRKRCAGYENSDIVLSVKLNPGP